MKKIIVGLILFFTLLFGNFKAFSQYIESRELDDVAKKCVNKYDIIVDAYYGYPYILGNIYQQAIEDTIPGFMINPKNINHIGGRVEYLIFDQIGVGIEYTYALFHFTHQGYNAKYYTAGVKKQRILAKFNFHLATTPNIDPYLTAGIGYTNSQLFSEDPTLESEDVNLVPVASRLGIGLRYFFTDMVGINFEAGLGGPLIQVGLSLKL